MLTQVKVMSRSIIGSCVDIYSKYPLLGMELTCKDDKITEFYDSLFFADEGLNYNEFAIDMGRESWITGEAWPFGRFNEGPGLGEGGGLGRKKRGWDLHDG